ncbi:MAG: flagellar biosynthesis protein FliR [Peptococcaceae bacterium BICA1-8]|nr:MAG: flagellar biosynthesis protein FliR [Peptococcaceae bacterium BICA1-8]
MENILIIFEFYPLLLAIILRITGFFISAPVFNSRNIPVQLKIALALILSLLVFFMIYTKTSIPEINIGYIFLLISEFLIGIVIGFTAQLLFSAIQLAGQSIDMQMGFGIVNIMDPQSGLQVPLMGTFNNLLAVLVFFLINGHHFLLEALFYSYQLVPIAGFYMNSSLINLLIDFTADLFLIALKLSAPLVGALFITDFVMGIIARTVPQMNVFLVGMPAKILSGFFLLFLMIPLYVYLLTSLFERSFKDIFQIIKVLI